MSFQYQLFRLLGQKLLNEISQKQAEGVENEEEPITRHAARVGYVRGLKAVMELMAEVEKENP